MIILLRKFAIHKDKIVEGITTNIISEKNVDEYIHIISVTYKNEIPMNSN